MNHIQYRLSLIRRDELLWQAADRRRANEGAWAAEASVKHLLASGAAEGFDRFVSAA